MEYNEKFPVLSTIAKILWIIGIIIVIVGVLYFGAELIEFAKLSKPGAEWEWTPQDVMRLVGGTISIISGVFTMAMAEMIGVLFAIEKNTRK